MDDPRPPVIEAESLTEIYHTGEVDVHALKGVSLTIRQGEMVAIMGHSGSGKSTLMSILGCLDRPTSGRYLLEGVDVAGLDEPELARIRSERLGFVFQSFNLLPRTSALENTAMPLFYCARGPSTREERLARAKEALGLVGLGHRANNTPAQLSGGEQQRVAIARALINDPAVLLADEPTGNLDTKSSHEIMQMLRLLNRERGVTVVVVTHEEDIAAYADRIVTMRDGEIVSDGPNPRPTPVDEAAGAFRETRAAPALRARAEDGGFARAWAFGSMVVSAALQALGRNKTRSALTMLGVFIGVAALIAMVAVGQGANQAVRKQIESLGTNLVVVMPGASRLGGMRGGQGSAQSLTVADAAAIARDADAVAGVSWIIRQSGQVQLAGQNWTTSIYGVSDGYADATNWRIASGRGITEEDDASASLVVVIGQTVARQLFASGESPLGAVIQVKSTPLRVIGVLAGKGQSPMGSDQDDLVMIPFSTAERKVLGVAAPSQAQTPLNWPYPEPENPYGLERRLTGYVNQIFVQAVDPARIQEAIDQITNILMRRHRIVSADNADFQVRNLSQIAETAESSSRIMALLLATVASISLVVGGIGIMNILLVSVTERTREIGLRMAIGARRLQVLLQFLAEAVILSVAGGLAGILFGVIFSKLISAVAGWPTAIDPRAIAGGFLFAAAVGVFFGYYPARKAARLDPIEALRYE